MKCAVPTCDQEARPNLRTCSPACSQLWAKVYRYTVEPEKHAANQARTILRRPEKYPAARVRWAKKVLDRAG